MRGGKLGDDFSHSGKWWQWEWGKFIRNFLRSSYMLILGHKILLSWSLILPILFVKILFIHERHTERGRDTSRGRSRLQAQPSTSPPKGLISRPWDRDSSLKLRVQQGSWDPGMYSPWLPAGSLLLPLLVSLPLCVSLMNNNNLKKSPTLNHLCHPGIPGQMVFICRFVCIFSLTLASLAVLDRIGT